MPGDEGWFDRFVNGLPESDVFKRLASLVLVPFWAWRMPVKPLPGGKLRLRRLRWDSGTDGMCPSVPNDRGREVTAYQGF